MLNAKAAIVLLFFHPPTDGEKQSLSSPHFHVFSYTLCVNVTQLHSLLYMFNLGCTSRTSNSCGTAAAAVEAVYARMLKVAAATKLIVKLHNFFLH